jgi:hypothetical protein
LIILSWLVVVVGEALTQILMVEVVVVLVVLELELVFQ